MTDGNEHAIDHQIALDPVLDVTQLQARHTKRRIGAFDLGNLVVPNHFDLRVLE